MLMLVNHNRKMGSPLFHEFKKQASFFFREKIKTARLALTDVTTAQLLAEEFTNGDLWPPDTRAMGVISRAAFEVDDYWRIVEILHKRLMKFDRKNWRVSYKTLLLLEHLLTHGPLRVAEEFQVDRDVIKEIGSFQFVDEKGFNWGLNVRNLSQKILKLLENGVFLTEERGRARSLAREIQGFGSFSKPSSLDDGSLKNMGFRTWTRCNSNYITDQHSDESEYFAVKEGLLMEQRTHEAQQILEDFGPPLENPEMITGKGYEYEMEDHPFSYSEDHHTTASLL